ncbi:MAG: BatD family protein [Bacteroidota bacterium]|nr:BatD family protein [Bacteroidota bacterium]
MKKTATIFAFLLIVLSGWSQFEFKTIVPQQAVVSGESFQVQYIIENGDKSINVKPPVFNNFRFVAGPTIYMGTVPGTNGTKSLLNAVYTLEATRPGKFIIPGASITVNGRMIRSNDVLVQVISKEAAASQFNKENGIKPSDYFLRPGENAYEKIRQNLFVKVLVDKKNCYVGEPVLATFKLYSRLQSKSDIVKNPGFYGFTVYDMVNLADKQMVSENVNGKKFDVHTIRKVQLYPLQSGVFTIDAMEVKNKVEFSKSAVNKKTEQEIVEGVFGNNDNESAKEGMEAFETDISTEPVTISVKPLPSVNKPTSFTGATGHFTIAATLVNDKLAKNEQGFFEITIAGKGNFIQLDAPAVQWPVGVEGFDPVVKDELDKTKIPLAGSRIFRYPFVCSSPGNLQLPSVSFSFFDTDSNSYKTVATKKVDVVIGNEEKVSTGSGGKEVVEEHKSSVAEKSEQAARKAGIVVVSLVLVILLYWVFRKKESEKMQQVPAIAAQSSIDNLLDPAYTAVSTEGNQFYSVLHGIIWKYAAEQFNLSGSEMSKQRLSVKMKEANIDSHIAGNLFQLLEECETGMFTNASLLNDKQSMLEETKETLEKVRTGLL